MVSEIFKLRKGYEQMAKAHVIVLVRMARKEKNQLSTKLT
jgi:hypothetical protein